MTITTSRTNLSREQHLARAATAAFPLALLALAGVFMKEAVLAMPMVRTDAAAAVVWTLWAIPVVMFTGAVLASVLSALRAAPKWRARAPRPSATLAAPRTAAFS
jgi:hypothetical protein